MNDTIHKLIIYLQKFGKTLTSGKKLLGGGIHIGTELGEGSDFTVLGQIQLHGTRNLFHGFHLGGGTDTGDGETDVNGWADTLMEKLGLEEDLAVSDGDDIGGDIGGHITSLGLNDGKGG